MSPSVDGCSELWFKLRFWFILDFRSSFRGPKFYLIQSSSNVGQFFPHTLVVLGHLISQVLVQLGHLVIEGLHQDFKILVHGYTRLGLDLWVNGS